MMINVAVLEDMTSCQAQNKSGTNTNVFGTLCATFKQTNILCCETYCCSDAQIRAETDKTEEQNLKLMGQ